MPSLSHSVRPRLARSYVHSATLHHHAFSSPRISYTRSPRHRQLFPGRQIRSPGRTPRSSRVPRPRATARSAPRPSCTNTDNADGRRHQRSKCTLRPSGTVVNTAVPRQPASGVRGHPYRPWGRATFHHPRLSPSLGSLYGPTRVL